MRFWISDRCFGIYASDLSQLVPLSEGTTHRDKMSNIADTGFSVACPGFVPACPGLVPSLSGTCKPLRNGQLSRFPQAVPAFFKKLCHIVPQAIFERKFSKSRKVNIGCLHGSRMGILTFLGTGFNTVILGMRGMRDA